MVFSHDPCASVGLARLPLVNSYARTPPLVWKLGWMPSPLGELRTRLPPLPLDYLQEKDILKEFIYRVNILGQFNYLGQFISYQGT